LPTDYNSDENPIPAPKKRGPKPGTPGQLRALANLRPPWKKGEVPNPSGRSKRTLTAALIARLGRKRALEVATALIDEAAEGNVFAFKELADRLEGKVAQRIELEGHVDLGLRIAEARRRRAEAREHLAEDESQAQETALAILPPASSESV
jgi:hypothetical protein